MALLADGIFLEGNALLCQEFQAVGEVRLNGCRIQRNLDCSGAQLINPHGFSLSAAGAEIKGTVYLCRDVGGQGAYSIGKLRLEGTHIMGDLDASGSVFVATAFHKDDWQRDHAPDTDNSDECDAFLAKGIQVDASVLLRDEFTALGAVTFIVARLGGDLHLSHARLNFPGEEAFLADGATIAGCTFLNHCRSSGLIRFVQASLKQGCECQGLTFDLRDQNNGWSITGSPVAQELGADICGLYAAGADVGGSFVWRGVNTAHHAVNAATERVVWLSAPGASVTEVSDDEASWDIVDRIDLRNCIYKRIDGLSADVEWRLARLDREYAPWNSRAGWSGLRLTWEILKRTCAGEQDQARGLGRQVRRFAPGPYLQLARVIREAGLEREAQKVLLRLERNRARYSGLGVAALLWRWIIDLALRHGLAPFRPVLFVVAWSVVSGILFKWVYDLKVMHSINLADKVSFNWLFYALDTLVPFVDFGQKKHFVIDPLWSAGGLLLLVNTIIGYAAASFFAAGLTGLVRTGRSNG